MSAVSITREGKELLRDYIERIEALDEEVKERASDKSEIYKEARSKGFDVKAMKEVIRLRRKDSSELSEFEGVVALYRRAMGMVESTQEEIGTSVATRARTSGNIPPHDPNTGEITESAQAEAPAARVDVSAVTGPDHSADGEGLAQVEGGLETHRTSHTETTDAGEVVGSSASISNSESGSRRPLVAPPVSPAAKAVSDDSRPLKDARGFFTEDLPVLLVRGEAA